MLSHFPLHVLTGCLLHATRVSSARIGIPIPIVIDATTVFTVAFSFLVIFCILTGLQFLIGLGKACGDKDVLPPDVSPTKYEAGRLYNWLTFVTVSLWWAQLIIYTEYVRKVFMQRSRRSFPDSAYIARYSLGEFTDLFMVASILQLIHYRRKVHGNVVLPFSMSKRTLDFALLVVHLAIICYTTACQSFSVADPASETKFLGWLTSYYVYAAMYFGITINVAVTMSIFSKTLNAASIKDEPYSHAQGVPGAMIAHALFKVIMAILYSQFRNPKIDYDVLRVFEVIVLGLTYCIAIFGLLFAGSINTEDSNRVKELKKLEKATAEGDHDHSK